jgi:DNA-binding response OmpR family regulator
MEDKKTPPAQKFTVCIVEDEALISEMYKAKLEQEGYRVLIADDGEKGLALIKENKPDIALIDLMMPHKDGFGLMKSLKEDNDLSKIPIIIRISKGNINANSTRL